GATFNSARSGFGGSHGKSREETVHGTALPVSIRAGQDVNLYATQDIDLIGTRISAQHNIDLKAGNDLNIRAAQNDGGHKMRRKSGGGELGVSLGGQDFIALYASVDIGKGQLDRTSAQQQTAYLYAGNRLNFT